LLILSKPAANSNNKWIYPAVVLVGFGLIDILFKQIALYTSLPFTSSLFVIFAIALTLMIVAILYDALVRKTRLTAVNILFGALVGAFNFGNILFYLKAHQAFADNPSTVFAAMNMGVIILGSLLGILIFKEKMSTRNYLGLGLALISIVLIALSQMGI
jgi:drug/metabolite transporter (DMT)-like permease